MVSPMMMMMKNLNLNKVKLTHKRHRDMESVTQ